MKPRTMAWPSKSTDGVLRNDRPSITSLNRSSASLGARLLANAAKSRARSSKRRVSASSTINGIASAHAASCFTSYRSAMTSTRSSDT